METFFGEITGSVANLMAKELQDLDLAKVQMTAWIQFKVEVEDGDGSIIRVDSVGKSFNSKMMEVLQGSNLDEIINEMFTHMRTQVKHQALMNSRFVFNRVLFLDVNFHQLNFIRGSSYLPLLDWISRKKVVINLKNVKDKECFKWVVLAALHQEGIGKNPQGITNLRRCKGGYSWRGLTFPLPFNEIEVFEQKNNISVNFIVLGGGKEKLYILRKTKYQSKTANLLLIDRERKRHYAIIKNLSGLLRSSNSQHQHKQHFCLNCLQGFHSKDSMDKQFQYYIDKEAVSDRHA